MHFKRSMIRNVSAAMIAAAMMSGAMPVQALEAPFLDDAQMQNLQPETQAETQSETQAETQAETQPETQAETQSETQPETQPETSAQQPEKNEPAQQVGYEEYYYSLLREDQKEVYRELYTKLLNYEDTGDITKPAVREEFSDIYYAVLDDHPELFWLNSGTEWESSEGKVTGYTAHINLPAEQRDAVKTQIEAAADACIAGIPEGASDYEKIKAVYEYIIDLTDYVEGPNDQNIQSVLIEHRSVCAGYSRTFEYILHRMGLFCIYVGGTAGGDHAWNIVRIDGKYYNVDVTWGDPTYADAGSYADRDNMNYNYLCVTDADLSAEVAHIPDEGRVLPACTDDSLNYYKLNGLYYETYDADTLVQLLANALQSGESRFALRYGSEQAYNEALWYIDNGLGSKVCEQVGQQSWSYQYNRYDGFKILLFKW